MLNKIVNSAANFAVVVLNQLAERIDRAGQKVVRAQQKTSKAVGNAMAGMKNVKEDNFQNEKLDSNANAAVMAKLNQGLGKANYHRVPTARHS